MKNPNFFIVGAPKSGTTAMSGYLGSHRNIFFSKPKEPCFFCTDFPGQCEVDSATGYFSLFENANEGHIAVGEGSVWYLYSEAAIRNIYDYDKNAKLIAMLRNPVEQVYSMHQELYFRRYEVEQDFTKAWNMQAVRDKGKNVPTHCKEAKFLQYAKIASYGVQVERALDIFPREQIKFIIFDDFKKDTHKVYLDVLDFLGVPDDGLNVFKPSLESRRHKVHWLGTFLINQPPWLIKSKDAFRKVLGIQRFGVRDMVAKYNTVVEGRAPLPGDFLEELKIYFRSDIDKLSLLLGRNLMHWYK